MSRNAICLATIFSGHIDKPDVACRMSHVDFRNGCVAVSNLGVKGHKVVGGVYVRMKGIGLSNCV